MVSRRIIVFLIIIFAFGSPFLIYNLRKVPEPGNEVYVTEIPPDVKKVLSTESAIPEITIRVPILLYHYVEYVQDKNDKTRQSLNIPPNILTSQIESLKSAGYTFINASELSSALEGKTKLPDKVVMLTFDDGYMDFYTNVFPILKAEQIKAVEYVVPDFLNRPNFMFTFQLKEIAKNPLVEIGAHTMDHVWLKGATKNKTEYEISQSRKELQSITDLPIDSFAYPYGAFDQQAIGIVKSAGFTNAVSTIPGIEHTRYTRYFLYRIRPGYRTGQDLLKFLKQETFKPW